MAPPTGLEPVTSWLTVMRSTDWANEDYIKFWWKVENPCAFCTIFDFLPSKKPIGFAVYFFTLALPTELWRNICVGIFLFFQIVTNQVSSAPMSLTSVFGMGTGGPSSSSTPTMNGSEPLFTKVTRGGIEPPLPAWEAGVLTAWPTSHIELGGHSWPPNHLVHHQGLEPWTPWLRVRCSTSWANGAYRTLKTE